MYTNPNCLVAWLVQKHIKSIQQVAEFSLFTFYRTYELCFSGLPHEVLQLDFFVPGSCSRKEAERYRNKELFQEILEVTEEITVLYFKRATQDRLFFFDFNVRWIKMDQHDMIRYDVIFNIPQRCSRTLLGGLQGMHRVLPRPLLYILMTLKSTLSLFQSIPLNFEFVPKCPSLCRSNLNLMKNSKSCSSMLVAYGSGCVRRCLLNFLVKFLRSTTKCLRKGNLDWYGWTICKQ